ncbi:DUF1963 domain-containing protein [Flagellimonas sp. S3867]|uniref:DUF1963 domain-containing protein n=1 Tax=Flagellimonas sp. S3867 TaxID=2768063 RepID=UPI0016857799|nr:DUF1963 domain-containing protein [Flagellimonas sp. S3867]
MSPYKKTRGILDQFLKTHKLEEHAKKLHEKLHNYLAYSKTAIKDESNVPLGTCKIYGLPHLPDSIAFPEGCLFIAQLNCCQLKPFEERYSVIPEKGIIYLFTDDFCQAKCFYYDGPLEALKVTPYPEQEEMPYGFELALKDAVTIHFDKDDQFTVLREGIYEELLGDKCHELFKELESALGVKIKMCPDFNNHYLINNFIFGEPRFWQDEYGGGGYEEDFEDEDGEGSYQVYDPFYDTLFCMDYGEGNLNFFATQSPLDMTKDLNGQIVCMYSGT